MLPPWRPQVSLYCFPTSSCCPHPESLVILRYQRRVGGSLSQVVCPNAAHNTPQPRSKTVHIRQQEDHTLTEPLSSRICVAAKVIINQISGYLITSLPRPAHQTPPQEPPTRTAVSRTAKPDHISTRASVHFTPLQLSLRCCREDGSTRTKPPRLAQPLHLQRRPPCGRE